VEGRKKGNKNIKRRERDRKCEGRSGRERGDRREGHTRPDSSEDTNVASPSGSKANGLASPLEIHLDGERLKHIQVPVHGPDVMSDSLTEA
jgi:hypothetical protein